MANKDSLGHRRRTAVHHAIRDLSLVIAITGGGHQICYHDGEESALMGISLLFDFFGTRAAAYASSLDGRRSSIRAAGLCFRASIVAAVIDRTAAGTSRRSGVFAHA